MENNIFSDTIAKWGRIAQLEMLQEEATELALAARNFIRGRDFSYEKLQEEIADTLVMIDQMYFMFLDMEDEVKQIKEIKLKRLYDLLNKIK